MTLFYLPDFKPTQKWNAKNVYVSAVVARVFDEILFRENFAKLATKRFSCFAKMRDEFREFRSFAKLRRLRKKRVSRNTKITKTKKT
jgi:hypothetical protein